MGGKVKKEEVSRVSIRDKLLVKEVQEMEENKPQYCKRRASGRGGGLNSMLRFLLSTTFFRPQSPASQGYGIQIFLSLLRPHSVDGLGWAPTRRLRDVLWGLSSL